MARRRVRRLLRRASGASPASTSRATSARQMERRIRSLRRPPAGSRPCRRYLKLLRARPRRARRVPRPRHDQRLRALPQPGAVRRAAHARCCPSCRAPARAQDLVGRLLVRRRGVHARLPRRRGLPGRSASRSSAPTSTAASWSAPSAAASRRRTCAACRRHAARRFFQPDGDGWLRAGDELRAHLRFRSSDLLRDRYEPGLDLVLCRNVVIYFTEATRNQVHRGIAQVAAARRLPHGRRHRACRRPGRRSASSPPTPSSTERSPDGRLRLPADVPGGGPGAPPEPQPRARAGRAGPDATRRRSTRSSASPTPSRA